MVASCQTALAKGNEVTQNAASMETDATWVSSTMELAEGYVLEPWWFIFVMPVPSSVWPYAIAAIGLPLNFRPLVLGRDLAQHLLLFTKNMKTAFGVPSWDQVATSRDWSVAI